MSYQISFAGLEYVYKTFGKKRDVSERNEV